MTLEAEAIAHASIPSEKGLTTGLALSMAMQIHHHLIQTLP
ncbi:MAG TPA: hypothetical protein V6D11_18580 [Waterburya sp.]